MKTVRICLAVLACIASQWAVAATTIFTAIGDQPYYSTSDFSALIEKINQDQKSSFTIHVGDIKNGSTVCSDERFLLVKNLFDTFEKPLIYTPGDNEWTDCHRKSNGSYEQRERLAKLRELFFTSAQSQGQHPMRLQRQSELMPAFKDFVENSRWKKNDLVFATLHQVGSNNNLDAKVPGAIEEYQQRNAANMAWLRNTFAYAKQQRARAIIIAMQSDIFDSRLPPETGYHDFITTIAELAQKNRVPILMIQGDSHDYVVDQPIKSDQGQTIDNILRLIVPGANLVEAVQVTVRTEQRKVRDVFTFNRYGF